MKKIFMAYAVVFLFFPELAVAANEFPLLGVLNKISHLLKDLSTAVFFIALTVFGLAYLGKIEQRFIEPAVRILIGASVVFGSSSVLSWFGVSV